MSMHRLVISAVLVLCVGSFSVRAYRRIGMPTEAIGIYEPGRADHPFGRGWHGERWCPVSVAALSWAPIPASPRPLTRREHADGAAAFGASRPVGLEYSIVAVTWFFSKQRGPVMRRSGTRG